MGGMNPFLERAMAELSRSGGSGGISQLPLSELVVRPNQPRRRFEQLEELAASIREYGVLEPLLVRQRGGKYEIISGERRYRAAELAGLNQVPAIVIEADDKLAGAIAIIENLQRQELNPFEETIAILGLLELELGLDRDGVVRRLYRMERAQRREGLPEPGDDRISKLFEALGQQLASFVKNRLPLLRLPEDLRACLQEGKIPYNAALLLKQLEDVNLRQQLIAEIEAGLSIRQLALRIQMLKKKPALPNALSLLKDINRQAKKNYQKLGESEREAFDYHLEMLRALLQGINEA